MAISSHILCRVCRKPCYVIHAANRAAPDICRVCADDEAADKKKKAMAKLSALTVEERLARIEEWIYDYKPEHVPPHLF